MIVQCNQCSTKFRINDANVGPRGAKVRCSRCQNVFNVAPLGKAAQDNDLAGDRTHAFDTSQFMRAAAAKSASNGTPPKSQGSAAAKASPKEDATSVVDASAFIAQMKNAEGGGAGVTDTSTQVVDARAFMNQLKSTGAAAAAGFGDTDNSTRVMSASDMAKLTGAPPLPPRGNSAPPPLPTVHDEKTRVGPVVAKSGESIFPNVDPHDKPTQVSAVFGNTTTSPWGGDAGVSHLTPAPFARPAGLEEAPAPASVTSGLTRLPGHSSSGPRLNDETLQANIPEAAVEAEAMAPPPPMSWAITAVAVLVLMGGFAVCFRAEQILAAMLVRFGSTPAVAVDDTVVNGLHLLPVRAQLYPLTPTDIAWVVTGTVENTTQAAVRDVDAVAELHDRLGRVVGRASAPVGLELDPSEIPTSPDDLQAVVEKALRAVPPPGVEPGAQGAFVAVLLDPPLPLRNEPQTVHLAVRPPLPPPAPEPPPAPPPAVVEEPPPAPAPVMKKGKGAKGKGKHRKGAAAAGSALGPS